MRRLELDEDTDEDDDDERRRFRRDDDDDDEDGFDDDEEEPETWQVGSTGMRRSTRKGTCGCESPKRRLNLTFQPLNCLDWRVFQLERAGNDSAGSRHATRLLRRRP